MYGTGLNVSRSETESDVDALPPAPNGFFLIINIRHVEDMPHTPHIVPTPR